MKSYILVLRLLFTGCILSHRPSAIPPVFQERICFSRNPLGHEDLFLRLLPCQWWWCCTFPWLFIYALLCLDYNLLYWLYIIYQHILINRITMSPYENIAKSIGYPYLRMKILWNLYSTRNVFRILFCNCCYKLPYEHVVCSRAKPSYRSCCLRLECMISIMATKERNPDYRFNTCVLGSCLRIPMNCSIISRFESVNIRRRCWYFRGPPANYWLYEILETCN